jgi:hypothetical protein
MNKELLLRVQWLKWLFFIISVFSIKFFIFCLDPLPMFFLGDSGSYIGTSLTGWIPPDRSFVYGFVIRLIAVSAHSLTSLVLVQIFASGLNAVLIAYMLQEFFNVRAKLAFFLGIICAVEPLQLMYERYVMTEAFSLFLFVVYVILSFHYVRRPRIIFLALVQIVGTALISFRMSYLPIVFINAFLLPLLILPSLSRKYSVKVVSIRNLLQQIDTFRPIWITVFLNIIVSVALTSALHYGYKSLNGHLSHKPPAYLYQDGITLLAFLGPVVEPVDFPRKDLTGKIFGNLKYDLRKRNERDKHHWQPGGIIANLNQAIPDMLEANHIAKKTAMNALKRDPVAVVRLAISGFLDYWSLDALQVSVIQDRGNRLLPKDLLASLSEKFSLSADDLPFLITFTNKYFYKAWMWYLFLLCLPLFAAVAFFISDREKRWFVFIVFCMSSMIVASASLLIEGPTIRYLHPLGWLSLLVVGILIEQILIKADEKYHLKFSI